MHLNVLEKLMAACEFHKQYEHGIEYGQKILRLDRAREQTHRNLMQLHYANGDRTSALRQFEYCRKWLREELDVCPAESTKKLYRSICTTQNTSTDRDMHAGDSYEANKGAVTELESIQRLLKQTEFELSASIKSIASAIKNPHA